MACGERLWWAAAPSPPCQKAANSADSPHLKATTEKIARATTQCSVKLFIFVSLYTMHAGRKKRDGGRWGQTEGAWVGGARSP